MDLSKEELDFTRTHRNMVKYTKLAGKGKGLTGEQFIEFYQAYCELYDLLCEYMNVYNRECKDYEQTINELYEEIERYRKMYFEEKEKNENKVTEKELKDMIIGMLE